MSTSFVLFLGLGLCPGIDLPGGFLAPQEEIGQSEGVIKGLGVHADLTATVGILDGDRPRCPTGSHCPPSGPARGAVLVPEDAGMGDQVRKLRQDVRLDRRKVMRPALAALFPRLNFLHGKLRGGNNVKPVNERPPALKD